MDERQVQLMSRRWLLGKRLGNTEHMHSQGMYLALYVQDLIESHQKILTV